MFDALELHEEAGKYFEKSIEKNKLHHAYALVGPQKVGKKSFALQLASKILNTSVEKLSVHPDFFVVEQEINEKTGKMKRDIAVEQIQELRQFTERSPLVSQKKVVLIYEAQNLNQYSSNALLKTLEEPKGKTLFFLLTEDENELLPTIRSRVHSIHLYSLENSKIVSALKKNGIGEEPAKEIACLSRGLPELAFELLDEEKMEEYQKEQKRFIELFGKPFFEKIKLTEDIVAEKKDQPDKRENLYKALSMWELFNRDLVLSSVGQDEAVIHSYFRGRNIPKETLIEVYKKILEAKKLIDLNVSPKLLIEQILLVIP